MRAWKDLIALNFLFVCFSQLRCIRPGISINCYNSVWPHLDGSMQGSGISSKPHWRWGSIAQIQWFASPYFSWYALNPWSILLMVGMIWRSSAEYFKYLYKAKYLHWQWSWRGIVVSSCPCVHLSVHGQSHVCSGPWCYLLYVWDPFLLFWPCPSVCPSGSRFVSTVRLPQY